MTAVLIASDDVLALKVSLEIDRIRRASSSDFAVEQPYDCLSQVANRPRLAAAYHFSREGTRTGE
jgi:hypothetical protein